MVLEKEFTHLGRGSAVIKLKLKGLETGKIIRESLKTDDLVEEVEIEYRSAQFLYQSGEKFIFLDPFSYQQYELEKSLVGEPELIKERENYRLVIFQEKIIDLLWPKKMAFEVKETENSVAGNTVTGATKPAKLETGLIVKVPLFIKKGEKIIINTETKEYAGRQS